MFASELKCVLESRLVDPRIDVEAIDLLMTLGYVPAPRTPLLGVRKLRPGAILVVDESGAREEVYWEYPRPTPSGRSALSTSARTSFPRSCATPCRTG